MEIKKPAIINIIIRLIVIAIPLPAYKTKGKIKRAIHRIDKICLILMLDLSGLKVGNCRLAKSVINVTIVKNRYIMVGRKVRNKLPKVKPSAMIIRPSATDLPKRNRNINTRIFLVYLNFNAFSMRFIRI